MQITGYPFGRKPHIALLAGLILALTACAEEELILPGQREEIRDVALLPDAVGTEIEGSRVLSLPPQTTNSDWAQAANSPDHRTQNAALRAAPQLVWSANIGAGDGRRQRITADPVVGGGRIYTLDSNAQVTAVSPAGAVLWSRDVRPARDKEGDATGGGITFDDGTLFVSLGFGEVAALDAATGATRWTQQLDATGSGRPTIAGDLLYLVAGDDSGWAIEKDTGRVAWQISATPSISNVLGAPAPAVSNKLAIFAFGSGELVATFRKGGLRRWAASVAGQRLGNAISRISDITGSPVIDGSTVYAGNHSGRIVALDLDSGNRIWTAREGALSPVWPAGDSVFAVTDRNALVRLDAATGVTIWTTELPGFVKDKPRRRGEVFAHYGPVMAGGRLVVASNDGLIRSFSPVDGSLIGTVEVTGGATSGPVVAANTLYVVTTRGQLHAFR